MSQFIPEFRHVASPFTASALQPRILCIGGEDHQLRIPFLMALRNEGFHVAAAGSGDPRPFDEAGIEWLPFLFNRLVTPLGDWKAIRALADQMRRWSPHLVQCFDTKPNIMAPLAARRIPDLQVVRTINGMGLLYSSKSIRTLALRVAYRILHRRAVRWTSATVFQNRQDKMFFEQHRMACASRSWLIPGSGIDVERFERQLAIGPKRDDLRRQLGLGASEVVMTVTRLTRQKGIPTLLEAAALVHERRPTVRFVLVGPLESEGTNAVSREQIERHAPYVTVLGPRADVPSLLGAADVFAFPTEYREGIPRVLLEASLAGVPIVTTDMPGCTDVICDRWNGLLVPPRSPAILASKIIDLLDNRKMAETMAARAASTVKEGFGLRLIAAHYAALYAELLALPRHDRPDDA